MALAAVQLPKEIRGQRNSYEESVGAMTTILEYIQNQRRARRTEHEVLARILSEFATFCVALPNWTFDSDPHPRVGDQLLCVKLLHHGTPIVWANPDDKAHVIVRGMTKSGHRVLVARDAWSEETLISAIATHLCHWVPS